MKIIVLVRFFYKTILDLSFSETEVLCLLVNYDIFFLFDNAKEF